MIQMAYRPQLRMPPPPSGQMIMMPGPEAGFDGKMLRKTVARKTVDYNPSVVKYLEDRIWKKHFRDDRSLQPDPLYLQQLTLPQDMMDNPVSCVTTKLIRAALNKDPRPVFCVCWTPDGRRLITGASSGEFTLWNGLTFNFETILQAHNSAVRSMIWSRNEQWMLTGDDKGYVKYWQANMNNVKMFQGHFEAIRGLSFSPTDAKFTSCSDDRTVRIFDFVTCAEENVLQGHGSDVKCVDWHPFKGLIVSGSKDSQQPIILWDAKNAKKITTIHAHKNTCTDLKWNQFNGNWLISSSRDHLCKLFDIRNLKEEVQSFRGHKKDACTVSWHPIHEKLFASGGADGSIFFWLVNAEKELGSMESNTHESIVWDLSWHPLGHMLVSGSNDRSTRFWTRNRPGDTAMDKIDDLSTPKAERATGIIFKNIELPEIDKEKEGFVTLPGLGLEKEIIDLLNDDYKDDSPNSSINNVNMIPPITKSQNIQNQQQLQQNFMKKETFMSGYDNDDDESRKRKAPYAKPIPKEFEKAWKSDQTNINMITSSSTNVNSLLNINVQPSSNLMQSSNQQVNKSNSQPMKLMDLMSTTIDPPPSIQQSNSFNNNKRKISNEQNTENYDHDERQNSWQPNKTRQFQNNSNYQKNSTFGNNNEDDLYDDSGENYNKTNNNQQNNNYNNNFRRGGGNQNRRGNYNNTNAAPFRFQSVKDQANNNNNNNNSSNNQNSNNSNYQNQNDDENENENTNNNPSNFNNNRGGRGGGMMNRGGGGRGGRGGFVNKNRFNNNNSNSNINNNTGKNVNSN